MPLPDSRLRSGPVPYSATGTTPYPREKKVARDSIRQMNDLADVMDSGPPETQPARGNFATIEDAAVTLGLTAARAKVAHQLIREIVEDFRDMMSIAKAAREAGIPQHAVTELIRRGVDLRYHAKTMLAKGDKGMPTGTTTTRTDGTKWRKMAPGRWEPVTDDRNAKGKVAQIKRKTKQRSTLAKMKGEGAKRGGKMPAPAHDPKEKREGKTAEDRFADIQGKAKAAGKEVHHNGEGFDPKKHSHDHMDALEDKLKEHIVSGLGNGDEDGEAPPADGDAAGGQPDAEAVAPEDEGHDKPEGAHNEHRLQVQVGEILDKLSQVEAHLDTPHQKGMKKELEADAAKVKKDPSPQAVQWLDNRTTSFIAMIMGIAVGAATGDVGAALAGGVEGKASKVAIPQKGGKTQAEGAQKVLAKETEKKGDSDKKGKKKPLLMDRPPPEVKKSRLVLVGGRLMLMKGGGWSPIPGGKHGGKRRPKAGGGWEYKYPGIEEALAAAAHHRERVTHHHRQANAAMMEEDDARADEHADQAMVHGDALEAAYIHIQRHRHPQLFAKPKKKKAKKGEPPDFVHDAFLDLTDEDIMFDSPSELLEEVEDHILDSDDYDESHWDQFQAWKKKVGKKGAKKYAKQWMEKSLPYGGTPSSAPSRGIAKDQLAGGEADDWDPSDFDPEQLAYGTKHEMEHTNEPAIAREIAMDHLAEDGDYYIKLREMEKAGDDAQADASTVTDPTDAVPHPDEQVRGFVGFAGGRMAKAGGWQNIPGGKHGGQRRRKAGGWGWEYRYDESSTTRKVEHKDAAAVAKRILMSHGQRKRSGPGDVEALSFQEGHHGVDYRAAHEVPRSAGESGMSEDAYYEQVQRVEDKHRSELEHKMAQAGVLHHLGSLSVSHGEKGWMTAEVNVKKQAPAKQAPKKKRQPPPPPEKKSEGVTGKTFKGHKDADADAIAAHYKENPAHHGQRESWAAKHPDVMEQVAADWPVGAKVSWRKKGKVQRAVIAGHGGWGMLRVHMADGTMQNIVDPNRPKVTIRKSEDALAKAGGWQPIPGGKKGGRRKRVGGKWVYDYAGDKPGRMRIDPADVRRERASEPAPDTRTSAERVAEAIGAARRALGAPAAKLADRAWHGVVHTAKEFPMAARAVGKLLDGDQLDKHEIEALVSVSVMAGTAALAASSYGATAAGGALSQKFVAHVAMAALHSHLNTAYTGYAALGFVQKLMHVGEYAVKAEGGGRTATEAEVKAHLAGMFGEMKKIMDQDWTPERVAEVSKPGRIDLETKILRKAMPGLLPGGRAPHPRNEHGHRDDLQPGMILHPRKRHADAGSIIVKSDGRFELGGDLYKGGHALLTALYGKSNHRMTVRRYFKLGGERRVIPQADVRAQLRRMLESEGVVVQRTGSQYTLTGNLRKAGIPDYMMKTGDLTTRIDAEAAFDLCRYLAAKEQG